MSICSKLSSDHSNLPQILEEFERRIVGWEDNLKIDGKNLEVANVEQASWIAYYDQLRVELDVLVQYFDMRVKQARAKATELIMKNSSYSYGERTLDKMIDADPSYLKVKQIFLEVEEVYMRVKSIVEQFVQRGYALKNIVAIRVAQLEHVKVFIDE